MVLTTDFSTDTGLPANTLPNLPGFTQSVPRSSFHKKQTWGFTGGSSNRTRVEFKEGLTHDKPKLVTVTKESTPWRDGSLPCSTTRAAFPVTEKDTVQHPTWRAFEHQTLRFFGYFKEHVDESPVENHRVRRLILYYHLEDDTIEVLEPRVDNAGSPQGTLVRRHRVPHTKTGDLKTKDGKYVCQEDLVIGKTVSLYGKEIQLVDCDQFTRQWYESQGKVKQPASSECPPDEAVQSRLKAEQRNPLMPMTYEKRYREQMLGGGHLNVGMQQFMEYDKKVCRFWAVLDETAEPVFERRLFEIFFFLADDNVEVREVLQTNSGRDGLGFSVWFRKGKLLKDGMVPSDTAAPNQNKSDPLQVEDFKVGAKVRLLSREFFIVDADPFTRQYFQEEKGEKLQAKIDFNIKTPAWPKDPVPPPTGYGSEEDSMGSLHRLIPVPPKKDVKKAMSLGGRNKALTFKAVLISAYPEDADRAFIVTFYPNTDETQVHEETVRNSGFSGGRFLQRGHHLNGETGQRFKESDFRVGNEVTIRSAKFLLTEMDERTRRIVENIPPDYPCIDLKTVIERIRSAVREKHTTVKDMFRHMDSDCTAVITKEAFENLLWRLGFDVGEQEVLTVMRHFDANQDGMVSYNEFCDVALDRDVVGAMLDSHAKVRLRITPDDTYAEVVKETRESLEEAAKIRGAVRHIQGVLSEKANIRTRLLKEFQHLTTSSVVNVALIQKAFAALGVEISEGDTYRLLSFVLPHSPPDAVNPAAFVQSIFTTFHDLPKDR
uniref:Calmodulin n=1 Tax=Chromera velia CCMP2878 TaxID=1169474 RepID=A0A0G4HB78_9ALVE|eukprot:Cvel_25889.t1-p1 / transcript=Cvel_25889.t1 / gene=Cvel_25889 / organism=Chromera_velia_CCMP2878 / gene_product=EF-hand domain-containing family member C2, putative / transcript_product=EF-hand domain-containing family member C2, putative / location=Cvel_scaffold2990:12107-16540(+) / protein_length=770 / sequence_SO=supercontig / SO=protein_coding / is_pseudo=false